MSFTAFQLISFCDLNHSHPYQKLMLHIFQHHVYIQHEDDYDGNDGRCIALLCCYSHRRQRTGGSVNIKFGRLSQRYRFDVGDDAGVGQSK